MSRKIVGILPNYYVHVLDLNTNMTTMEVGPQNLVMQDNHSLQAGPLPFITIPPAHYCSILNPINQSKPIIDGKLYELKFGHQEVRLHGNPFPLFPGEMLGDGGSPSDYMKAIKKLPVIKAEHGIHLKALVDIPADDTGHGYKAGDEWQLKGPLSFVPRPEVEVVKLVKPVIVNNGQAIRLKARQKLEDKDGKDRYTGEEWLIRDEGAYLPGVYEEVVEVVDSYTLTPNDALLIRAKENYTDEFGKRRSIGEEWLVTLEDTDSYIADVTEEVVRPIKLTVLTNLHYCIVINPLGTDNKNRLGCRELRKGPAQFFLQPGETLEKGIQNAIILESDEALVLRAQEEFDDLLPDGTKVHRSPGDRWMVHGPCDFIPRIEIGKTEHKKAIPLNENEGVYVRDIQSGQVRAIVGPQSYLLQASEELYKKELTPLIEEILKEGGGTGDASIRKTAYFEGAQDPNLYGKTRDKTRVVTYRCPSNCAVQVYNYIEKTARVVFGPDLVVLEPHEAFNVLSLSAGKPKKENALKTICLMLGPDFISDHITVETSDHARLKIALAMNNEFRVERDNLESEAKLFSVPDFIGFACREVASRIRGTVASVPFEQFHKFSADIITAAVFGKTADSKVRSELVFTANNLVITNIDIQSIEPVDQHMRDSLSKSVQMAIEISTRSIERFAQHEAKRTQQKACGELERQKLQNEEEAEEARKVLLELQAIAAAVESTGQAKAEAQAQAEKLLIEGQSEIEVAKLKAEAAQVELDAELESQTKMREAEIQFLKEQNELEIARAKQLSEIEVGKFSTMVSSMKKETIERIARSGPESKMRLLQGLGIKSLLITDGKTPVNLYGSPNGTYNP